MTSNDLDPLLAQFLSPYKSEIEDNGFSGRVAHQLPPVRRTPWLVRLSLLAGILCALYFLDVQVILSNFLLFWKNLTNLEIPTMEVFLAPLLLVFLVFIIIQVETDSETAY